MDLNPKICDRARKARDPRFDGLFYTGVRSTGIYCRPVCPAPSPKPENIVYYPTAAAAAAAGLRPCLRCRPEASPGTPLWNGTSATISRAMGLIQQGALNHQSVDELALRLGIGARHLRRLFKQHIGAAPKTIAQTQRVLFAKKLIHETHLPLTQIAFASGFGSIRRFNATFRKLYGKSPSEFRQRSPRLANESPQSITCNLMLPYRPPFDWPGMLVFFRSRAIPGVECVDKDTYSRTITIGGLQGWIRVSKPATGYVLNLEVTISDPLYLMQVVSRVRRIFDLDANLPVIHEVLAKDPMLAKLLRRHQGLRLPGTWDPFEVAVRAVVGQQISVKAARTVLGRIAAIAGIPFAEAGPEGLTRCFPSARELLRMAFNDLGMPKTRKRTLETLADIVAANQIKLDGSQELPAAIADMVKLPGIGEWTAQYIAMRGLGEPDAFPAGDLGIRKALAENGAMPTEKQVVRRAENWRPWRAYGAIYLWHSL
ncbi:MAG: DNA-3-methyladenine glycosylase 2 family protein [Desulfobacteraceae bacterium]|nr:DNA-3-methyladenine glycosylase 2 family protein [Desulfobacteraceae bacterium]